MAKSRVRKITKSKPKNPWTLVTGRSPSEVPAAFDASIVDDAPFSEVVLSVARTPSKDEIRTRAYELYVARSGAESFEQPRRPIDDWLDAERELAATG